MLFVTVSTLLRLASMPALYIDMLAPTLEEFIIIIIMAQYVCWNDIPKGMKQLQM